MLIKKGMTMTDLALKLSEKIGKEISVQNLNQKLSRETVRYIEMKCILEILGYKIDWVKSE
jgi:hypothetical protein